MLTKAEKYYLEKLERWENAQKKERPNKIFHLYTQYFNKGIRYIPNEQRHKLLRLLNNSLFHLHTILFNSTFQRNTAELLTQYARTYNESIFTLNDMRKLNIDQINLLANKQIAHYRMLALGQGMLASKHTSFLMGDFLSIIIINIRAIQVIASVYGRPANNPFEMMTALKVFCAGCLPKEYRMKALSELMAEWERDSFGFFYQGTEELVQEEMLQSLLSELIKLSFLHKGKTSQTGTVIGATVNYRFTKNVTDFAHHYYQKVYLLSKQKENK